MLLYHVHRSSDQEEAFITCFSDVDWCGDKVDKRSTAGYLFKLYWALISWCSRKQLVVPLSSCEEECISGSYAVFQAIWIGLVLKELKIQVKNPITMQIEDRSAINMDKSPILHGRSKHIEAQSVFTS